MNWYIGQKVVWIAETYKEFVNGKTYTIKGLQESLCKCNQIHIDVGVLYNTGLYCLKCNTNIIKGPCKAWQKEENFRPLEEDFAERILENALPKQHPVFSKIEKEKITEKI